MSVLLARAPMAPPPRATYRVRLSAGRRDAVIACPDCGFRFPVTQPINSLGMVTGIVRCPAVGCTFADLVELLDWNGGKL